MTAVRIGLIGDYDPAVIAHQAIPEAVRLASEHVGLPVHETWVHTATLRTDLPVQFGGFAGVWCVPASPYANTEGALAAIRYARESGIPFLGTCGGFQHAVLEYVRDVLGYRNARHAELDPEARMPVISRLSCSLVEKSGRILFEEGSRLRAIYAAAEAEEGYHCNYGLNPTYVSVLGGSALRIAGRDPAGEVRAVELDGHPFFFATLYQPERAALKHVAHPLVNAFAAAAADRADGRRA
jgi:CTP synthase (UTP-ammonia lyase)